MTQTYRIYLNLQQAGQPTYAGLALRVAKNYVKQLRARGFADANYVAEAN